MNILGLFALAITALSLIPGGAHFFSLPHKMAMEEADYFVVQGIYAGWALFAVPVLAAIVANGALFFAQLRRQPAAALAALTSAVLTG